MNNNVLDQLCAIERLGDVYEKKRRLKELKELVLRGSDGGEFIDSNKYDDILDRIRRQEEDTDIAVAGLLDTEEVDGRSVPEEVVGDIDDLLQGMTLDDGDSHVDVVATEKEKVVYVKPGRRYTRVVRQGGGRGQVVKHHGGSACSGDDEYAANGGGVGPSNTRSQETVSEDEDEEKKRYYMTNENNRKTNVLSVDIPVAGDVLAKAANRVDGIGVYHVGGGSSGSTHACDVVDVQGNGGESSGDESITSPAVGGNHVYR